MGLPSRRKVCLRFYVWETRERKGKYGVRNIARDCVLFGTINEFESCLLKLEYSFGGSSFWCNAKEKIYSRKKRRKISENNKEIKWNRARGGSTKSLTTMKFVYSARLHANVALHFTRTTYNLPHDWEIKRTRRRWFSRRLNHRDERRQDLSVTRRENDPCFLSTFYLSISRYIGKNCAEIE